MRLPVDQPFDLAATLECGQGHRWKKTDGGWYEGVMGADVVLIKQRAVHGALEFDCELDEAQMATRLHRHFRLDDDIEAIYADLRKRDGKMSELVERYPGMRVMRIDPWECLVFFILSARSPIKRIHDNMENLSRYFGKRVNDTRYTFPKPKELVDLSAVELQKPLVGLKSYGQKVHQAAKSVEDGSLDLDVLAGQSSRGIATTELMKLWGVGDKIANCVALFSLEKLDAFPVDTHIGRNLKALFRQESGFPQSQNPQPPTLRKWAQLYLGTYAGYASQFFFIDDYKNP